MAIVITKIGIKLSLMQMQESWMKFRFITILRSVSQSALARYEIDDSTPSPEVFLKYADYFDVSLDYIFGRTDDPHGMIYNNCVKLGLNNPEMARFVEMCFDPSSAMNERLKATLVQMLSEVETK